MKARVLFISLAVLILFCCIPDLSAQDTSVSFTIAPPPAGYPVFEKGHTDYRIGANFVTIDSDFMSITGAGIHGTYRRTYSSRLGTDASFGLSALVGDAFDTTMMQMSFTANGQYLLVNSPSLQFILLAGIGGDVIYSSMSMEVMPHGYYHDKQHLFPYRRHSGQYPLQQVYLLPLRAGQDLQRHIIIRK